MSGPPRARRPLTFTGPLAARLCDSDELIAVTGGSGWLGMVTLEMLSRCLGDRFAARVHVFGSAARELELADGRRFQVKPMQQLEDLPRGPLLMFHFAFLTRDRVASMSTADYVAANRRLSAMVDAALRRMTGVKLIAPSSGAVYRTSGEIERDLENNPYGVLKAEDETRTRLLAEGHRSMRALVPRVFNISGPYINKLGIYALACVINDILDGGAITIKSGGRVLRSYVHANDLLNICMSALLDSSGKAFELFDTRGDEVVEIGDLARRAAAVLGAPGIAINRPQLQDGVVDRYVGNDDEMRRLGQLHGVPMHGLDQQIADTAADLVERRRQTPSTGIAV